MLFASSLIMSSCGFWLLLLAVACVCAFYLCFLLLAVASSFCFLLLAVASCVVLLLSCVGALCLDAPANARHNRLKTALTGSTKVNTTTAIPGAT